MSRKTRKRRKTNTSRKTRKKYQASVQQTFCVKERLKKYSKDAGNLLFTLVISEVISAVFHSEAVASIFASIKEFL
ncbi:hypothetical protein JP88_002846 [Salmonella enterica subsp. enterica]|uniref:Uncharacterized protein n=1 Tax=Salmonella enterica TaxID=28901 RepID=A0A744EKV2_SALER|nr:hypothetical protein [Salmonella enterica]EBX6497850.1 hypothetical protein [Salmonella enterica subsp. enterica serovar Abony]EDD8367905.1 hypothetical protein [Salmonella enterica subsp. enterica serovar Ball]EBO9655365.1 hypothetical protein [Salmonella enterica]EBP0843683.1 hypothetical protein [Salmonella enterica]